MGTWINQSINQSKETFSEKFSIGSLLYTRLRRSTSRVIDVMYLSENNQYARYVIELAFATTDEDLHRLALRLQALLTDHPEDGIKKTQTVENAQPHFKDEPTEEDIIREQVAHRYIGSLR